MEIVFPHMFISTYIITLSALGASRGPTLCIDTPSARLCDLSLRQCLATVVHAGMRQTVRLIWN